MHWIEALSNVWRPCVLRPPAAGKKKQKSPVLAVRGFFLTRTALRRVLCRPSITWQQKRQQQRQRRQQPTWQHRQKKQQHRKRRRKPQQQRRTQQRQQERQAQQLVLERVLPRELVLARVLPSCHKRRVQQQRSGRPERENSSFRFSYLDRQILEKPWRQAFRSPITRWHNALDLHLFGTARDYIGI